MYFLLEVPVRICFQLFDADARGLGIPNAKEEEKANKRRRLPFKGANDLLLPPVDKSKPATLPDLLQRSMKVVDYIWRALECPLEATVFEVAAAYWPAEEGKDRMFKSMSADMLKAVAGIKWRICYKFHNPPYCLLDMLSESCTPDTKQASTRKFCEMRSCCLDPFWGRPIKDSVLQEADQDSNLSHDEADALERHVRQFARECRGASIREEHLHAAQKKFSGGATFKARSFLQQSAQTVLAVSSKNFIARRHQLQKRRIVTEWQGKKKTLRKGKVRHARPKQLGNPSFSYVAHRLGQGSKKSHAELRQEFKDLSAADKEAWVWRHQTKAARKRQAQAAAEIGRDAEEAACKNVTP